MVAIGILGLILFSFGFGGICLSDDSDIKSTMNWVCLIGFILMAISGFSYE